MKTKILTILKEFSKILLLSIIVGVLIGLYQLIVITVSEFGLKLYNSKNIFMYILLVLITVPNMLFIKYLVTKLPTISGSGIPLIANYFVNDKNVFIWKKHLPGILYSSLFSFFTGLSLGSEGPSVTLAANASLMVNSIYKKEDKDLVKISAASGFGCAFSAPLAGIMYAVEIVGKKINFMFMLKACFVICLSCFIAKIINHNVYFDFNFIKSINFKQYYLLAILVPINILIAYIFSHTVVKTKDLFGKYKNIFFVKYRFYITITLALVLGFTVTKYIGNQIYHDILNYKSIKLIFMLLVFKIIYTAISANSMATGGLLIPICTLGAITGLIIIKLFHVASNIEELILFISILSMFAYTTNSSLTALALGVSYANIKFIFIPLLIVLVLGKIILKIIKFDDIYTMQLKRL